MASDVAIEQVVNLLITFIPLIIIIGILASALISISRYGGWSDFSASSGPSVRVKPKETPREEAERILMDRFARGEMTEEQYTSAMARL